jgi:hypothetical protein
MTRWAQQCVANWHDSILPVCFLQDTTPANPAWVLFDLRRNREAIDKITEELLEKETLNGDEFRTILAQYATIPEENIKAVQEQFEAKQAITV